MRIQHRFGLVPALFALQLCCAASACQQAAQPTAAPEPQAKAASTPAAALEEDRTRLWLTASSSTAEHPGDTTLSIELARGASSAGPRIAELLIAHSEGLVLRGFEAGAASTAAGKDVVVQEKDARTYRVVVLSSTNVNELGSGALASLHLERTGTGPAHAELVADKPAFAPMEANDGLLMGDPVTF